MVCVWFVCCLHAGMSTCEDSVRGDGQLGSTPGVQFAGVSFGGEKLNKTWCVLLRVECIPLGDFRAFTRRIHQHEILGFNIALVSGVGFFFAASGSCRPGTSIPTSRSQPARIEVFSSTWVLQNVGPSAGTKTRPGGFCV